MNYRSLTLISVAISLIFLASCATATGETEARKILAEVGVLQERERSELDELTSRENIWFSGALNRFPENRLELELIARKQVETLTRILDINQAQVVKLRSVRSFTHDSNIATYSDLQAESLERRIEGNRLSIRRFSLIYDPTIESRKALESKLAELDTMQSEVDKQMEVLDSKLDEYRNRRNR
jgi:hypothetical protein